MKKKKVLSLFSGCGGMDIGFEGNFKVRRPCLNEEKSASWILEKTRDEVHLAETIFETVFANDILPYAKAAWDSYFPGREGVFRVDSVVDLVNEHKERGGVFPRGIDVVTGGFPCNDFSVSGYRKGFNSHKSHKGVALTSADDPTSENRGLLYMWMREVVELVRPRVFVAENVKGLVSLADVKAVIESDFSDIGDGYLVIEARVLHAGDYGVPQSRERVFFIGLQKKRLKKRALDRLSSGEVLDIYDPYPPATHAANPNGGALEPHVGCGRVLDDLKEPEVAIDPDQRVFSRARWYGRHCQGQAEINMEGLGPTIRAEHHGNIEFRRLYKKHGGRYTLELKARRKERRLTVRECARIQTFPDNYHFIQKRSGSRAPVSTSDAYRLIGNAVPPLLAYHLARRLQEIWDELFKK